MITVQEAFDRFLYDKSSYCAAATLKKYTGDIKLFFSFLERRTGKAVTVLAFPEWNIYQEYIIYLRSINMRTVTIHSYCRSIKSFLRWAYECDYCPDYLKGVKLPKNDAMIKVPLYADEVQRIDACMDMNTLLGRRNYCIVHLMLDCGLRTQEVVHLRCEDVNAKRNLIQIKDSKGNKSRMTLIPDFLLDALAAYSSGTGIVTGFLFRNARTGEPITGNAVKMLFQNLKTVAAVPRLHAHLLRHTFATSYLIGGGNLEFLRVFMGHSDYAVTQKYSQLAAEMKMLGADIYRLDSIFFTRGY